MGKRKFSDDDEPEPLTEEPRDVSGTDASQQDVAVADAKVSAHQVYIQGIKKATDPEIRSFFEKCGAVQTLCNRYGEPRRQYKREVVYATFKKRKAADKAIAMTGSELAGHRITVALNTQPLKARKQAEGSERVYVGNLPEGVTTDTLQTMFKGCGEVLWVRLFYEHEDEEKKGQFRGFAHVIFKGTNTGAKQKAFKFDGAELGGNELKVGDVPTLAEWKEQRREKEEADKKREAAEANEDADDDDDDEE